MTGKVAFSIIIPTRNERKNLKKLLPVLVRLYPENPIWIVDDNSADGTEEFIKQSSLSHPQVHLISRKNKLGRGSAVIDGFKQAVKDKSISYFLEMDADFSHDPNEIEKLLAEGLLEGGRMVYPVRNSFQVSKTPRGWQAEGTHRLVHPEVATQAMTPPMVKEAKTVIIGSRHIKGAKFINCSSLRVVLSKLANWYAGLILSIPKAVRHPRGSPKGFPWGGGNRITDYTNGFRLYPREAVKVLLNSKIREKGYVVLSETAYILYKSGFQFKEVPTIFINRKIGRSNATIAEFLKSLLAILKIRFFYTF